MNSFKGNDKHAAAALPKSDDTAAPEEPAPAPFESTMVIYLGSEKKVVGWVAGKPNEPMDVSTREGNIFEPHDAGPARSGAGERKPGPRGDAKPKSKPKPGPASDEPTQPEKPEPPQAPKELIG